MVAVVAKLSQRQKQWVNLHSSIMVLYFEQYKPVSSVYFLYSMTEFFTLDHLFFP